MSAWRRLEVVLDVERDAIVEVRPGIGKAAASLAADLIEKEVGKRGAAEVAGIAEDPKQAVVAGIEPLLLVVQQLAAGLHRVAPLQPRELLVDLVGLVDGVGVAGPRTDAS